MTVAMGVEKTVASAPFLPSPITLVRFFSPKSHACYTNQTPLLRLDARPELLVQRDARARADNPSRGLALLPWKATRSGATAPHTPRVSPCPPSNPSPSPTRGRRRRRWWSRRAKLAATMQQASLSAMFALTSRASPSSRSVGTCTAGRACGSGCRSSRPARHASARSARRPLTSTRCGLFAPPSRCRAAPSRWQ